MYKVFQEKVINLNANGINPLYSIYALVFFIFVILSITILNFNWSNLKDLFSEKKYKNLKIYLIITSIFFLLCCFTTFLNYLETKDYLIIKQNIYFILSLLFVNTSVVYFTFVKNRRFNINLFFRFTFCILIFSILIALFQVFTGLTFSFTVYSNSGLTVYRGASIFLNPNTYAIWLCIIYMFLTYNIVSYKKDISKIIILMICTSFGLYLTGSRGVLILLFLFILTFLFFTPNKKYKFYPLLIVLLTFIFIYLVSRSFVLLDIGVLDLRMINIEAFKSDVGDYKANMGFAGISSLERLGERYFHAPIESIFITIQKLREHFEFFDNFMYKIYGNYNLLNYVNIETFRSYSGRFLDINKTGDNGWINFYYNFLALPTILLFFKFLGLLIYASKKYFSTSHYEKKIRYGFSISFFIFYILIYLIMKASIFPVILMLSIIQIYVLILFFEQEVRKK